MNEEQIKKEIDELKRKIQELENWKQRKEQQQISFPLDQASQTIINNI